MSFISATRLTLFALISAIEIDLRRIIISEIGNQKSPEEILENILWINSKARYEKDLGEVGRSPSLKEVVLYIDFGDLYQIINRNKAIISPSVQDFIKINTQEFEKIVPVRNRVAHSRPLLFDDFQNTWDMAEKLIEKYSDLLDELDLTFRRIKSDPSFVLSLKMPELDTNNPCTHNLPIPDFDETGFIGRDEAVKQLIKHVKGPYPVITIVGEGGLGKTALAVKIAYDLLDSPDNPFQAIVWTTTKTQQITAGQVVEINYAIRNSLGMFQSLSNELVGSDVQSPLEEVLGYLKEFKILLILDNLETVIDERINEFMMNIPSGTKILITSRIGLGAFEVPVKLDSLDTNDSVQLLRALARIRGVNNLLKIQNRQLTRYCQAMKNNPGYIKWFVSAVQSGQRPEDVLDNSETFLEFCMSNVYNYLNKDSVNVLKSMQAVPGKHSQSELGFINNTIDTLDLQRALAQLLTTNMVNMYGSEKGSTYESTYDISELARAYLDISHPLVTSESLYFSRRRHQLVSQSEAFASSKGRDLYKVKTIVTRSKRDFVIAKTLYDVVNLIMRRDNLPAAKYKLDEARRLAPEYYEVRRVEAFLHTINKNLPAAQSAYEAAIQLEPKSAPLHYWYGLFLMRELDDIESALTELEKAQKIDPNSLQIQLDLLRCNLYLKDFDKAFEVDKNLLGQIDLLEDAVRFYDLHLQVHIRYAEHLESQHKIKQAVERLELMINDYNDISTRLKDETMIMHIKKAIPTARRLVYSLNNDPDWRARAEDVSDWIEHL